jgi:Ca-activated chloride channel homolog
MLGKKIFVSLTVVCLLVICSCSFLKHSKEPANKSAAKTNSANIGSITGKVVDDLNAPLPGVSVTLESESIPAVSAISNSDGSFLFPQLPPGKYSVTFSIEGFTMVKHEEIRVQRVPVRIQAVMRPALAEQFTVIGESPAIETTGTAAGVIAYPEELPAALDSYALTDEAAVDSDRATVAGAYFDFDGVTPEPDEVVIIAKNDEWNQSPPADEKHEPSKLEARNIKGESVGEFPLQHTEVESEISGYVGRTVVRQEYKNPFNEAIEAVYVFPLPSMAAVNGFLLEANGHRIMGIVLPRQQAESMYRTARERGMTASLLTQERPNIFTQSIANIEPGSLVSVEIEYFERLVYENGSYQFIFPMVVGSRYVSGEPTSEKRESSGGSSPATGSVEDADRISPSVLRTGERSGHDIGLTVRLDAGLPIESLKSVSHQIDVQEDGPSKRIIQLSKNDTIPNRDFILEWSVAGDSTQFATLAHRQDGDGFFTLMIQPPLDPADADVSPREITFIMDVSGSMKGLPIELSKELVSKSLDRIRPQDLFNIVYFSGTEGQLFDVPETPTIENLANARKFLKSLRGNGGTEMMKGLKKALDTNHDPQYLQMYCFLTDGYVGEDKSILKTIRQNKEKARFFAFGIGSAVNRYLIDGIAEAGGGFAQVVVPENHDQGEGALNRFFAAIDSPVLIDPQIDWNALPVEDVFPKHLPNLFAGQTISLVGRYEDAVNGTILVKGRVGAKSVQYEVPIQLPAQEHSNVALGCLWARQRIHELSKSMWMASPDKKVELATKITDLATKYHLASDYTSFVAVDESRITSDGKPLKILQPVEIPAGVTRSDAMNAAKVDSWGMSLRINDEGKLVVAAVEDHGIAAQSGVKAGAILLTVNRVMIHDIAQLETLLLQTNEESIQVNFQEQGPLMLPRP